jgi:hypothetical protein
LADFYYTAGDSAITIQPSYTKINKYLYPASAAFWVWNKSTSAWVSMTSGSYNWISSLNTASTTCSSDACAYNDAGKLVVSLSTANGASYKPYVSYKLRTTISNP